MSQHDPFAEHLRSLESRTPPVRVDRARVLAAGRRRRGVRAVGAAAGAALTVVGICTAVAALPLGSGTGGVDAAGPVRSSSPPTRPTATVTHVPIDPVTGIGTLPRDSWTPTATDVAVMQSAWDLAMARCMDEAGYGDDVRFVKPESPDRDYRPYGVYDVRDLEKYGYVGEPRSISAVNPMDLSSPGAWAAHDACLTSVKKLGISVGPEGLGVEGPVGATSAALTTAGRDTIADWADCLRDHDLTPPGPDEGFTPREARKASLGEQVRIGKIDIACKKKTDLMQRMADIDAAQELAYAKRAQAYLAAAAAYYDPVVANARAYLADAGYHVAGDDGE